MKAEKQIIELYSLLTGVTDEEQIYATLKQSDTFLEVMDGNEAYLYEGYIANILEIAQDLRDKNVSLNEISRITPENIRMINRAKKLAAMQERELIAAAE